MRKNLKIPKLVGYPHLVQIIFRWFFLQDFGLSKSIKDSQKVFIFQIYSTNSFAISKALHPTKSLKCFKSGKTTMAWLCGFKLHLVINHHTEIVSSQCRWSCPIPKLLKACKEVIRLPRREVIEDSCIKMEYYFFKLKKIISICLLRKTSQGFSFRKRNWNRFDS